HHRSAYVVADAGKLGGFGDRLHQNTLSHDFTDNFGAGASPATARQAPKRYNLTEAGGMPQTKLTPDSQ
ncbi:MAG: hypothetical protein NT159_09155, partial [Proteobacteria bacterium]|nr:hypothetical protein [Pseudomonadota bacterium]